MNSSLWCRPAALQLRRAGRRKHWEAHNAVLHYHVSITPQAVNITRASCR